MHLPSLSPTIRGKNVTIFRQSLQHARLGDGVSMYIVLLFILFIAWYYFLRMYPNIGNAVLQLEYSLLHAALDLPQ